MTPPAVHVGVIPVPATPAKAPRQLLPPSGIIVAGIRYRACHVTTLSKPGPHLRKPNPPGLQSASALCVRLFGPVSIEALIAVLVILDPDNC